LTDLPKNQSVGDFLVDVMMNQFDLANWNDNDESDLHESIDLIKDYYNVMRDRLRRQVLEASPMQEFDAKLE
jgi:hypothetical protein